jgi:hypothetical protein
MTYAYIDGGDLSAFMPVSITGKHTHAVFYKTEIMRVDTVYQLQTQFSIEYNIIMVLLEERRIKWQ